MIEYSASPSPPQPQRCCDEVGSCVPLIGIHVYLQNSSDSSRQHYQTAKGPSYSTTFLNAQTNMVFTSGLFLLAHTNSFWTSFFWLHHKEYEPLLAQTPTYVDMVRSLGAISHTIFIWLAPKGV